MAFTDTYGTGLDALVGKALGQAATTPDYTGQMAGLLGRQTQLLEQREADPTIQKLRDVQAKTAERDIESINKAQDGIEPIGERLQPWNADAEMAKYSTNPVQSFGSAGSVFAILASLFTHTPMINAFKGSAAAISAINAGDDQAYKNAYDAWLSNTKLALDRHQAQHQDLMDALEKGRTDPALLNSLLTAYSSKYDDQIVGYNNLLGAYDKVQEIANSRQTAALNLAQSIPKIEQINAQWQAQKNYQAAVASGDPKAIDQATQALQGFYPQGMFGALTVPKMTATAAQLRTQAAQLPDGDPQKAQLNTQADQLEGAIRQVKEKTTPVGDPNDPTIRNTAKLIASYQWPPLSSFAMSSPRGQAIASMVATFNPSYQASRYAEVNRAMTAFGTGTQGNVVRSMNVSIQHLNVIDELGRALENKDQQTLNKIRNAFEQEFGQPMPTNFDAAKNIVADEIVKAIVGYSGAYADREKAQAALSRANSWPQLQGVTTTVRKLMAGQLAGLKQQYEDATGFKTGEFSFDTKLAPETRQELEKIGGKTAGPSLDEFMARARAANPTASDDDLRKYWEENYGGNR